MRNSVKTLLGILIIGIILVSGCTQIQESSVKIQEPLVEGKTIGKIVAVTNVTISMVYDNYVYDPRLRTDWGISCLVRADDKSILFDTGGNSKILLYNMEKLKIKPEEIDIVVLSHIHGDHVGGLFGFLEKNSDVKVYLPKSFPASFKDNVKSTGAVPIDVHEPCEVCNGIYTTGELNGIKEQSLVINTNKGLVIISGCAHPGIVKIVRKAKGLTNQSAYLVMGGFHLSGASDATLKNIINSFRKVGVKKVAPCHCSGDRCRELFKEEYKEDFISNGVGKVIRI